MTNINKEQHMTKGQEILAEVKAKAAATKKAEKAEIKATTKPWYINMLIWVVDTASIVVILALAIYALRNIIKLGINPEYALAISVVIVGALAFRTVERLYRNRK